MDLNLECSDIRDDPDAFKFSMTSDLPSASEMEAETARQREALLAYSEAHPRTGAAAEVIDHLLERWTPRPPPTTEELLRMSSELMGDEGMTEEEIQSSLDLLEKYEDEAE